MDLEIESILETYRTFPLCQLQLMIEQAYGVTYSVKKLGEWSRRIGVYRRKNLNLPEENQVRNLIQEELKSTPASAGYRTMWLKLIQVYNVHVGRSTVMKIMKELQPEAVNFRHKRSIRRRQYSVPGPDYQWHIDGYDKLKRFGFAIHGCIDGYSRKIIWLNVAPTNNNPKVVGEYFLRAVKDLQGLPTIVRGDKGTENVVVEQLQTCLRSVLHQDKMAKHSFIYGKSASNQRIERLWGSLREGCTQFIMDYFNRMQQEGIICTADPVHIECMRYCFMNIIRDLLAKFVHHWNSHYIRKSKGNCIPGIPTVLYSTATDRYTQPVDKAVLQQCERYTTTVPDVEQLFLDAVLLVNETFRDIPDNGNTTMFTKFELAKDKLNSYLNEFAKSDNFTARC